MPYTVEKPSTQSVNGKITTNGPPASGLGVTGLVGSEWNTPVETYRRSVLGDTYM